MYVNTLVLLIPHVVRCSIILCCRKRCQTNCLGRSVQEGMDRALKAQWEQRWLHPHTGMALKTALQRVGDAWSPVDAMRASSSDVYMAERFFAEHCHLPSFNLPWCSDWVHCPWCREMLTQDHRNWFQSRLTEGSRSLGAVVWSAWPTYNGCLLGWESLQRQPGNFSYLGHGDIHTILTNTRQFLFCINLVVEHQTTNITFNDMGRLVPLGVYSAPVQPNHSSWEQ